MRRLALPVAGALLLATTACSGMGDTEQRVLSGGAIGAGVGVASTIITGGCIACGAAIGGAVGAASGWLLDEHDKGSF